jgi:D-arabinose 1-dehydrogenase-like Zn-dependent alcohol dehydrogenase
MNGKLVVTGASAEAILAWPSGISKDSEETMAFSALSQIRPMIETMPLERAPEAYDRMMSGKARFRMVLTTGQ